MRNTTGEDKANVRFPPPLVPVLTILLGVFVQRVTPIQVLLPTPARYWIGGFLLGGALLVLGVWPVVLFRRSGQSEIPWKPTPSIVEAGPYRFTRNPMYLQMVWGCVAFGILLSNMWVLVFTPACAVLLQKFAIEPEEAYLERKFGEGYSGYKRRVRRWL